MQPDLGQSLIDRIKRAAPKSVTAVSGRAALIQRLQSYAAHQDGRQDWSVPVLKSEPELSECAFRLDDVGIACHNYPRVINRWLGAEDASENQVLVALPLSEDNMTRIEGRQRRWGRSDGAFLMPLACPTESTSSSGGETISLVLNLRRLEATARLMMGQKSDISMVFGEGPRLLSVDHPNVDHRLAIESLVMLVAAHSGNPDTLSILGFSDLFYRQIAMLCFGPLQAQSLDDRIGVTDKAIHRLCEQLRWRLEETITVSMLEELSGLSERSLQYGFRRKFGVSPLRWVRQQRLHLARELLRRPAADTTVTGIAYRLRFPSHSAFASFYLKAFHETPSQTLTKGRRAD